jgi:hypothetical protein
LLGVILHLATTGLEHNYSTVCNFETDVEINC